MLWEQKVEYAAKTDVGLRRKNNEDAWIVQLAGDELTWSARGHLFAVADGMGGHAVGELASKIAADTLPHAYFKRKEGAPAAALKAAIEQANATINARGSQNRDFQRMGTTCTALALTSEGAWVGHVGDSRVYRIRRDRIEQLSFDHSLQWELQRRSPQQLDPTLLHEHRNVITRSLGPEPRVEVDLEGPYPVQPYDLFVLCSDGLTSHVLDEEIAVIARELPPAAAAHLLVHLANIRGGTDNCTVVVVRVAELPGNVLPPTEPSIEIPPLSLGWKSLFAFWAVGVFLVCGLTLCLFGFLVQGLLLTGSALAGGVWAGLSAWREREAHRARIRELQPTRVSQPYRQAVARPVLELLEEMKAIGEELRQTAEEDGWTVNWERHGRAVQAAGQALVADRPSRALREYAKVIDALMSGMQLPQQIGA